MTSPLQQKIKISGPVVVTANRLTDGAVVYFTATRTWSEHLTDASVVTTASTAAELLSQAVADDIHAVGPYIAPVDTSGDVIQPGNLREKIRLNGLTFDLPASFGS